MGNGEGPVDGNDVGDCEDSSVGCTVCPDIGRWVGRGVIISISTDGNEVGTVVGETVVVPLAGWCVKDTVGIPEGAKVGRDDGSAVGAVVGELLGRNEGNDEAVVVGLAVSDFVGFDDGDTVTI